MPNFVLKIDGHREFNVMSEKSFGLRYQKFTLNNSEKFYYDACKQLSMRDQKAIELSRFLTLFEQELLESQNEGGVRRDAWTQNEILILIREVLAEEARTVKEEKEILS